MPHPFTPGPRATGERRKMENNAVVLNAPAQEQGTFSSHILSARASQMASPEFTRVGELDPSIANSEEKIKYLANRNILKYILI